MAARSRDHVGETLEPIDVQSLTTGQIRGVRSPALKRVLSALAVDDSAPSAPAEHRRHSDHMAATQPQTVLQARTVGPEG